MSFKNKLFFIIPVVALLTSCGENKPTGVQLDDLKYEFPLSLQKEAARSLEKSYDWLVENQGQDGSWKSDPAITALVLYALVEQPGYLPEKVKHAVISGYAYLEGFVKTDGSIYDEKYRNYSTAVSMLAFTALQDVALNIDMDVGHHPDIIFAAKKFLIGFQCDEGEGISETNTFYGGVGYGGDERPDLSNTQLALEAIKLAEDFERVYAASMSSSSQVVEQGEEQGIHWEKARVFLARCQNLEEVNDMPYRTQNDGGFMYETGTYKNDRSHSYGSMTYAGVKSLLYAQVDKDDIRVKRALEWIQEHYTMDENPMMGTDGLYYYYMTFSKCMNALGIESLFDAQNNEHFWREDIVRKLVSLQREDGTWVNENARWFENIPDLSTAYGIISLKFAFKGIDPDSIR